MNALQQAPQTTTTAIETPAKALAFMLGGNAIVTLRSAKTGVRYTYRISRADDRPGLPALQPTYFVSLLSGPENTSDYTYLGMIQLFPAARFRLTRKSRMTAESLPVRGFAYTLSNLARQQMPANVEVWHEGRCGRCGRTLTVPESIASGFGPECAKLL